MYRELIDLIRAFDTKESKKYWINNLGVCDSIKGYLLLHFKLIG